MYKGLELLLNIRSTTHAHISPVSQIHDLQSRMCRMLNIKAATRGCGYGLISQQNTAISQKRVNIFVPNFALLFSRLLGTSPMLQVHVFI